MRIRIRYFLLFLALALIVGYFVGCLWPIVSVLYSLSSNPVDKGQHVSNLIAVFVAIFTLLAVIVALFKDEIIGNFKNVDLDVDVLCDTVEECYNETQGEKDPSVAKYYNHVIFKNKGNINALDCELHVEKISFKGSTDLHFNPVNINKKIVLISGQDRTYIPKDGGQREAKLLEIMSSEDPNGIKKTQLSIADNTVQAKAGKWIVEYCLNMSNASIKHCKFEIEWDGNWHENRTMMQVQIKQI